MKEGFKDILDTFLKIIFLGAVLLIIAGVGAFKFQTAENQKAHLLEANLNIVPIKADGEIIDFTNADENKGESLIIKSDKEHYEGYEGNDVYFSVTNISKKDEKAILLFYFPTAFIPNRNDPPGAGPATITELLEQEGDNWKEVKILKDEIYINKDQLADSLKKRTPIPDDFKVRTGAQIEIPAGETVYFKTRLKYQPGSGESFG